MVYNKLGMQSLDNPSDGSFRVRGDDELGLRMSEWHGGMGSAIYAVSSSFLADRAVSSEIVDDALVELEGCLSRLAMSARDKKHLKGVIGDLENARAESAPGIERHLRPRDVEFPYVELDGNLGPKTVEELSRLLHERVPSRYPMQFPEGSDGDKISKRAGLNPVRRAHQNGYTVSKDKFIPLIMRWLRSRSRRENDLANSILATLQIHLA